MDDNREQFIAFLPCLSGGLILGISPIVASGYSYGSVLLLIGAAIGWFKRTVFDPNMLVSLTGLAFIAYAAYWIGDAALRTDDVSNFDRPSRLLLAGLCVFGLNRLRLNGVSLIWIGAAFGGWSVGILAILQKYFYGNNTASMLLQKNELGLISLTLLIFCLIGTMWMNEEKLNLKVWCPVLLIGAASSLVALYLSASRGAWAAMLFVVLGAMWGIKSKSRYRVWVRMGVASVLVASVIAYLVPATGVSSRVSGASQEVTSYFAGEDKSSSTGYRFEMWRGAATLFAEKPFFGWGQNAYKKQMKALSASGVLVPKAGDFAHAHNMWMDVLAKKGLTGTFVLTAVFVFPAFFFMSHLDRGTQSDFFALVGFLMILAFLGVGLTRVPFADNSGVMIYGFMIALLSAITDRGEHDQQ